MTETLRFGLIAKEDLSIGTSSIEARLADGRVVTLTQIRLTDFLSALTSGSVLFVKAGGVAGEDNANLFWDDTNNRLGVGTASPSQQLHVVGIILSDANLTFKSGTSFTGTLDHAITADRTWTLPDSSDTVAMIALAQTLTNKTILAPSNTVAGVLDRDVLLADVVDTLSATTVYSFSVPAGTLSTNRAVRLSLIGDYLNNSGGNSNLTVSASYGGTTVVTGTFVTISSNASRRGLVFDLILTAANATGAQYARGVSVLGQPATATGLMSPLSAGPPEDTIIGTHNGLGVDSGVDQTFIVQLTHSVANANISARALAVHLEVLR